MRLEEDALPSSRVVARILGPAGAAWLLLSAAAGLQFGLPALVVAIALGAAVACLLAAWVLPPLLTGPWAVLALGAVFAAAQAGASLTGPAAVPLTRLLAPFPLAVTALGVAWLLHQRDRGRDLEIVLDAGLLILVLAVIVLRWAPGARDLPLTLDAIAAWVMAPVAAGTLLTAAAVLLATPAAAGSRGALLALAAAVTVLAIGGLTLASGREPCCAAGEAAPAVFVAGWSLVACAAAAAALHGGSGRARPRTAGVHARQLVAPAAGTVAAVVLADAALRPPVGTLTAAMLGTLCVLLALRVGHLLRATRLRSAERLELAQSRALVEVSQSLAGALDVDRTLELVAIWTCRLLGGQSAGIELLEGDGATLVLRAAHGLGPQVLGMRFPVENSFTGWVVEHGLVRSADDPRLDPRFRSESRSLVGRSPTAAAPLRCRGRTLGALWCIAPHPFDRDELELLCALGDQAAVAIENARLFQQVNVLSKTDPLTGLANRRQLEHDLSREFAAARRGRRLIAVMFDVNEFKDYNDRHGHLAGDDALRAFGEVLAGETRAMNLAARYGGDEFLTLLADTGLDGAEVFVQRVAEKFPQTVARLGRGPLSVSWGIAEFEPGMRTPQDLIAAVDRALYANKAANPSRRPQPVAAGSST